VAGSGLGAGGSRDGGACGGSDRGPVRTRLQAFLFSSFVYRDRYLNSLSKKILA